MAPHGYFAHESADGSAFWRRISASTAPRRALWSVGENLLWSSPDVDARGALKLWLASPEHRQNLLNPTLAQIGVSAVHVAPHPAFQRSGRHDRDDRLRRPPLAAPKIRRAWLRPGVWHWQSPHPDWDEKQWWPELVSSYAIELGDDFLLFDPLSVPDELRERATAVVLTAPYHERDARRLGLPVHTPPADTWEDWVEKFGVDPDRVRGMESEDLAWLRAGEGEGHFHGPGAWPFGIQAYAGREDNDLILWLPPINAIVTGDSLSDFGDGLDIQLGGRKHVTRDDVVLRLRPLLDLPIELVLPAHGEPTDRAALERVLSCAGSDAPGRIRTCDPRLRRPLLYPLSYGRARGG